MLRVLATLSVLKNVLFKLVYLFLKIYVQLNNYVSLYDFIYINTMVFMFIHNKKNVTSGTRSVLSADHVAICEVALYNWSTSFIRLIIL